MSDTALGSGETFSRVSALWSDQRVMQRPSTRISWAVGIAVAAAGLIGWPLATGAGLALAAAAVFAGLRIAAGLIVVIAVALAVAGVRIDADTRDLGRARASERGR